MDESERQMQGDTPSTLREIRRRMGNSHALLRSIIRRSADSASSVESYARHLEGRLDAIGRIALAVVLEPGIRFDLRRLIADELYEQHAIGGAHACSLNGPPVMVGAAAAEALALLFHELVTNSVEHGVLGMDEGGELRVSWRIEDADGGGLLRLDWTERGAPATLARRGFGTMVLEGMLRHQLGGTATRSLGPDGVRISLALPMRGLARADLDPPRG